jgi:hypothetical protein
VTCRSLCGANGDNVETEADKVEISRSNTKLLQSEVDYQGGKSWF